MRWSRRKIVIGTSAGASAIALAVALVVVVLPAHHTPPAAPKPSSARLFSPFTGEPVTARAT